MEGVVEKAKELLRILALHRKWMKLAKVYIAELEMEIKELRRGHVQRDIQR